VAPAVHGDRLPSIRPSPRSGEHAMSHSKTCVHPVAVSQATPGYERCQGAFVVISQTFRPTFTPAGDSVVRVVTDREFILFHKWFPVHHEGRRPLVPGHDEPKKSR
jgi:hypothetical protein